MSEDHGTRVASKLFPDPNHPPREIQAHGPGSGVPGCPRCDGVGHRFCDPTEAGWTRQEGGWWTVPKTENGIRCSHRFSPKGPERLLRPCECVAP